MDYFIFRADVQKPYKINKQRLGLFGQNLIRRHPSETEIGI